MATTASVPVPVRLMACLTWPEGDVRPTPQTSPPRSPAPTHSPPNPRKPTPTHPSRTPNLPPPVLLQPATPPLVAPSTSTPRSRGHRRRRLLQRRTARGVHILSFVERHVTIVILIDTCDRRRVLRVSRAHPVREVYGCWFIHTNRQEGGGFAQQHLTTRARDHRRAPLNRRVKPRFCPCAQHQHEQRLVWRAPQKHISGQGWVWMGVGRADE